MSIPSLHAERSGPTSIAWLAHTIDFATGGCCECGKTREEIEDGAKCYTPVSPVVASVPAIRNTSGITPLDHRVLVLHDPVEERTAGGIILPDSEIDKKKFATTNATVISVGALAWSEAKHDAQAFGIDADFPKPGDRVKVGRYTGDQHKGSDGKEYTILNDSDIIGILEE